MPMIIRRRKEKSVSLENDSGKITETFCHIGPGSFLHTVDRRAWSEIRDRHAEGLHQVRKFTLL